MRLLVLCAPGGLYRDEVGDVLGGQAALSELRSNEELRVGQPPERGGLLGGDDIYAAATKPPGD